jgi:hypothetical protein
MDIIVSGSPFVSDPKIRKSLSGDGIDKNGLCPFFVNNFFFKRFYGRIP